MSELVDGLSGSGFGWLDVAFTAMGAQVTWLEALAFSLALACVILTVLEVHWGWPLAIISSLLYSILFRSFRLYGEAGLQLFFAAICAWGWWQWLYGKPWARQSQALRGAGQKSGLQISRLGSTARVRLLGVWLAGWGMMGWLLGSCTDSDVPWLDAFPTAGSVLGQLLLARKLIENWGVWLIVNLASVLLFAYKGLLLTALLYLLFAILAVLGYLRWRRAFGADPHGANTVSP